MAGRPKLEDSRDKQYRVRLNGDEDQMLDHVSQATGVPKSEIFRQALLEYSHKVKLNETITEEESYEDIWGEYGISLQRVVECPYCGKAKRVNFSDVSYSSVDENRPMGEETTYEFDTEFGCGYCKRDFHVEGYICEYPPGAFNSEKINVSKIDEYEEDDDE